jgi:CheY-like chemotaxis protein
MKIRDHMVLMDIMMPEMDGLIPCIRREHGNSFQPLPSQQKIYKVTDEATNPASN